MPQALFPLFLAQVEGIPFSHFLTVTKLARICDSPNANGGKRSEGGMRQFHSFISSAAVAKFVCGAASLARAIIDLPRQFVRDPVIVEC